jgi:hypothetical protein
MKIALIKMLKIKKVVQSTYDAATPDKKERSIRENELKEEMIENCVATNCLSQRMEKYITNAVPPKPEVKFCRVIVRNIIKILLPIMDNIANISGDIN